MQRPMRAPGRTSCCTSTLCVLRHRLAANEQTTNDTLRVLSLKQASFRYRWRRWRRPTAQRGSDCKVGGRRLQGTQSPASPARDRATWRFRGSVSAIRMPSTRPPRPALFCSRWTTRPCSFNFKARLGSLWMETRLPLLTAADARLPWTSSAWQTLPALRATR